MVSIRMLSMIKRRRYVSSGSLARQVFREVANGAKTDRAQLRRVLAQRDVGDVLIVRGTRRTPRLSQTEPPDGDTSGTLARLGRA